MNARDDRDSASAPLVDIIHFKWLMSHEGRHVHVERLQADPSYAAEILTWAESSLNPALAAAARSLRAALAATR